jgi:flagellar hook-associated protein 3 FlgL
MNSVSYGDLAYSFLLRRHTVSAKAELQSLNGEVVTGQVRDITAHVRGDVQPLAALDSTLSRLDGYAVLARETGLMAESMQTALGTISSISSDLSEFLISSNSSALESRVSAAGSTARANLNTVVSALNTRFGDQSIFAGKATASQAVTDSETLLTAVQTAAAGATSAADVQAAVSAWFDDPAGYEATIYQGGAPRAPLTVADGEQAQLNITAVDPAIKETLKGLTMAALLDKGILANFPAARQQLAKDAGLHLLQSNTDRAYLTGRLGGVQAQIDTAASRNSAESTTLKIVRNEITTVDPYEAASKLQDMQSQLEKIYTLTARMTRLSLMDYL